MVEQNHSDEDLKAQIREYFNITKEEQYESDKEELKASIAADFGFVRNNFERVVEIWLGKDMSWSTTQVQIYTNGDYDVLRFENASRVEYELLESKKYDYIVYQWLEGDFDWLIENENYTKDELVNVRKDEYGAAEIIVSRAEEELNE